MASESRSSSSLTFRPRARVLQLLGEELIGSPRLAVFELVKNAYDACAPDARVKLMDLDTDEPWIEVIDHGEGMTLWTIENVWMVPGHDHRKRERIKGDRSRCGGRLPLGEKGLGRFAAHKLGDQITLVTRPADEPEHVVQIDWEVLAAKEFLSDAKVKVRTREPEVFKGKSTGTRIRIRRLKPAGFWKRGEVRRLYRQITSICSPFDSPDGFDAKLEVPGKEHWVADIPEVDDLIQRAFWHFEFSLNKDGFCWSYEFEPLGLKLEPRKDSRNSDQLLFLDPESDHAEKKVSWKKKSVEFKPERHLEGIGDIGGEIYVYDRDKEVLLQLPEPQQLQQYLDNNGGIQVFRDGIRIYNYGEPGDDWLGLDLRRVQTPTRKLSRNLVIGAIHLSLEESTSLQEKTNREGFVENEAFTLLRNLILGVLIVLESQRYEDKARIRQLLGEGGESQNIKGPLEALKKELKKANVYKSCARYVEAVERHVDEIKENLLRPVGASINLSIVFHEVERGVRELLNSVKNREDSVLLERQARDMVQLLEDFSKLLRRHQKKEHRIAHLVDMVRRYNALRFKHHKVILVCGLSMDADPGFTASFPSGLMAGALSNLIDNAIYWLRFRWPDDPDDWAASPRKIYIGESHELSGGPALVVADNGQGFKDDPADLVRPFYTRRPEGMGIGLYYTNMVMELCGGRLVFPQSGDVELPDGFDGAVVALQFPEVK